MKIVNGLTKTYLQITMPFFLNLIVYFSEEIQNLS